MLTIKAIVDEETYRHIVDGAVEVDSSIPHHAGVVLRRAVGLPTQAASERQIIDLVANATDPKTAA